MKIFAANDEDHLGFPQPPSQAVHLQVDRLYANFAAELAGPTQRLGEVRLWYHDLPIELVRPSSKWSWKVISRQLFPSGRYPANLRDADRRYLRGYQSDMDELGDGHEQHNYAPTLLTVSQKVYDGEISRRESINTRCGAVLSTGGILGALVVAAGQLGLMRQKGSFGFVTGLVWVLFGISLLYLGLSIAMALKVQGDIQGDVVGPHDLLLNDPRLEVNKYDINTAKTYLGYAVTNWCLNNEFKSRLNSAQRYLRNGIVAIIIAGVLSPLLVNTTASNSSSVLTPVATHQPSLGKVL
jgi:hypothetical protein